MCMMDSQREGLEKKMTGLMYLCVICVCFVFRRLMSVWLQGGLTALQRNSGCRFHFSVAIPPSAGRVFLYQRLFSLL